MKFVALHGFLGLPSDWLFLKFNQVLAFDLFSFYPHLELWDWATKFNYYFSTLSSEPTCLIGYSLGGRLALHALIHQPNQWQAAILISTHTGMKESDQKKRRLESDQQWAERFRKDPWDPLISDWNGREAFSQDAFAFQRLEHHYQRDGLAQALESWSLGKQDDLERALKDLPCPILWMAGEKDFRYTEVANSLTFAHPQSNRWIAPHCGHRLPWEQPLLFNEKIQSFLRQIMEIY
jgi:2-succinyl-6-hydroxy-2,4-cyclohexadiene-1-carboxylate synthase